MSKTIVINTDRSQGDVINDLHNAAESMADMLSMCTDPNAANAGRITNEFISSISYSISRLVYYSGKIKEHRD